MTQLLIGALALAVLTVVFGLVSRHAPGRPKAGCGGCTLASVCDHRGSPDADEACRVGNERERHPGNGPSARSG